jgi:hypothetical protein
MPRADHTSLSAIRSSAQANSAPAACPKGLGSAKLPMALRERRMMRKALLLAASGSGGAANAARLD